jgi:hypothetical protein
MALWAAFLTNGVWAQHADIRLSYEDDSIVLREGIQGFIDGFQIYEGTFPISGFSIRFTENPGFAAELIDGDVLLPGDEIEIELLESSNFNSYLTFFDPATGGMLPTLASITIDDNGGSNTSDLIVGNLDLAGDNPQFLQTADDLGEMHTHINFTLSAEAQFGAYGLLFRLVSSNPMIADSSPAWLVFNYGMSPVDFEQLAIPAFMGSELLLGDVNRDGLVNLLDVQPFVDLLTSGGFQAEADINQDGVVNLLDVDPMVALLTG